MTDCSSSIHGSTSSSEITSSRGGAAPRIRIIRLIRPNVGARHMLVGPQSASFGFAIRGGREFGTGFFVSRIEKGSEADVKGLRVGDQIIRVNGYHIDDAVHRELSQYVLCQDRLTLKVRGVGMLPIKDRPTDPLSWHIVPLRLISSMAGYEEIICQDARVTLHVKPRTKLGLGICKGPDWKPGIFVQFVKDLGVAKDSGLRPGDQILSCNGIDFGDVLFSEAVAVMKSSHTLEMHVRTAAGLDLFPGESSGYNSSASSVTGDQSPRWTDQSSKRLTMVREETANLGTIRGKNKEHRDLDKRKDRLYAVQPPRVPSHYNKTSSSSSTVPVDAPTMQDGNSNTTIIKLSESGTVINNTSILPRSSSLPEKNNGAGKQSTTTVRVDGDNLQIHNTHSTNYSENNIEVNMPKMTTTNNNTNSNNNHQHNGVDPAGNKGGTKLADICFVSRQSETKTITVEVHRSAAAEENNNMISSSVPPPPPPMFLDSDQSTSSMGSESLPGSMYGASLSSAISDELKKRAERTSHNGGPPTVPLRPVKKVGSPAVIDDDRHSALMDEFKRAHKKMFKMHNSSAPEVGTEVEQGQNQDKERQSALRKIAAASNGRDETDQTTQSNKFIPNGLRTTSQKIYSSDSDGPPETPLPDYDSTPSNTLPKSNGHSNGSAHHYQNVLNGHQKAVNAQAAIVKNLNGTVKGTMGRVAASEMARANGDVAEMESIESFKMNDPSSPIPRPPSMYFAPQSSGPPTMKKNQNQRVSVTIGEYGGGPNRKEPSKFDFIERANENQSGDVSERLRSELEKTLSRSNLKNRNGVEQTLKDVNLNDNGTSKVNVNQIPNGSIANGKAPLQKTQSNVEKIAMMLSAQNLHGLHNGYQQNGNGVSNGINGYSQNGHQQNGNGHHNGVNGDNKVTINIAPNKMELRKTESSPPSGILKNGMLNNGHGEHKNITFGNVTTLLGTR